MKRTSYHSTVTSLNLTGLSPRNRAVLARGVRGGDGDETVDDLLGQLDGATELDDDALASLISALDGHVDGLVEAATAESLEALQHVADAIDSLRVIQVDRANQAAEREAQAAELLARIRPAAEEADVPDADAAGPEDEDEDDDDQQAEPEAPPAQAEVIEMPAPAVAEEAPAPVEETPAVPERVAASAPISRVTRMVSRAPDMRPRPRPAAQPQYQLRASANVPGIVAGDVLDTADQRGLAFSEVIEAGMEYRGPRTKLQVATIGGNPAEMWGDDRFLNHDERDNDRKIKMSTNPEALRASGGACIAPPIDYARPVMGTDVRPVRDALNRFAADRGGVQLTAPATLASMAGATDDWPYANDVTPSDPATKPCLTMTCPTPVITRVDAITQCIKVGNFRQLYWPEQVDEWVTKSAQYTARHAETNMLTRIGAGSTNVNVAANGLGTTRTVLGGIDLAAAGIRNRQRIGLNFPLRCILPGWLLDNMRVDLSREHPGATAERLAMADAELSRFFTDRNINITWTLDGESGQLFSTQADGALNGWPSHAIGYLFVEGQWLYLDGGRLNLGIIRDATLVGTNDFIMFSEFMENVAFHGEESLRIDFDICPNGRTSGPLLLADFNPCVAGS